MEKSLLCKDMTFAILGMLSFNALALWYVKNPRVNAAELQTVGFVIRIRTSNSNVGGKKISWNSK